MFIPFKLSMQTIKQLELKLITIQLTMLHQL